MTLAELEGSHLGQDLALACSNKLLWNGIYFQDCFHTVVSLHIESCGLTELLHIIHSMHISGKSVSTSFPPNSAPLLCVRVFKGVNCNLNWPIAVILLVCFSRIWKELYCAQFYLSICMHPMVKMFS